MPLFGRVQHHVPLLQNEILSVRHRVQASLIHIDQFRHGMGLPGEYKPGLPLLIEQGVQTIHLHTGPYSEVPGIGALSQRKGHGAAAHLHTPAAPEASKFKPDAAFQPHRPVQIEIREALSVCRYRQDRQAGFRAQPQWCHRPVAADGSFFQKNTMVIGLFRKTASLWQNRTILSEALRAQVSDHSQSPLSKHNSVTSR